MQTRSIFALLGLLVAAGAFAEAYTWTDEQGIVHYSDRPHPGAKTIDLGESSNRRRTARPQASAAKDDATTASPSTAYESLEIARPGAEETLWNIEGTLSVSLALTPALRPGDQVRVYFDGTPQTVGSATFTLQNVYRGVHNLQVEVIDKTGKLMIRSRPSRFYVQQNSIG
jgi:hypothetical protein